MEQPIRGFPEHEFQSRVTNLQSGMQAAGIDLVLLTTEADVRYFSGFLTLFWQSPTRPWYLLLPQFGKPVAVIPGIGAECMGNTWIEDIRTWSSPHRDDDGISLLAQTISQLAGKAPVIGLMKGRETHLRIPLADFERLRSLLGNASWSDATDLVQGLRSIKSELEIDKIRYAAQIASNTFAKVPEIIGSGMGEIEAFRAFKIACLEAGADDVPYLVGGAGQGGYGDIISPPSDRKLEKGDILILDVGCVWDGYHCDFDRNFAISNPDMASQEAYGKAWEATEAGLKAAKPGATCSDLFKAMNNVMMSHAHDNTIVDPENGEPAGDVGRLGHGLGMQLTEFPSHTIWDETLLADQMVLTLEPGYNYAEGKMMVHEENIVVRQAGVELLSTRAAPQLPILD